MPCAQAVKDDSHFSKSTFTKLGPLLFASCNMGVLLRMCWRKVCVKRFTFAYAYSAATPRPWQPQSINAKDCIHRARI